MFIHETGYRLGEFILIEHNSVLLTWLLQCPMGTQRSGKCYVVGNIVVILPWDRHGPGFLRMEFHDHLMKLPEWHKTTFYCYASNLRQVATGRTPAIDMIEKLAFGAIKVDSSQSFEPGSFRLSRYKIITDDTNALTWQTLSPQNRIISSTCLIESGILLLSSKKEEFEEVTRRSFLSQLKLLPTWNSTSIWGYEESIRYCQDSKPEKARGTLWTPTTKNVIHDIFSQEHRREESSLERNVLNNEHIKGRWAVLLKFAILTQKAVSQGLRVGLFILKTIINYAARKLILWGKHNTE